MKKYKNICFIVAMAAEAKPLIERFDLKAVHGLFKDYNPLRAFQKKENGKTISLIINGKDPRFHIDNIGTQGATLAAVSAIEYLNPDLLINAGTAGGFSEFGLDIGDVVIAQGKAYYHDRRVAISGFRDYGLGAYPLDDWSALIEKLKLKRGTISSGNAFGLNEDDQTIMEEVGTSIKDMEATAIAWIAWLSKTKLIIIKGVTDLVNIDVSNEEAFLENLKKTTQNLTDSCEKMLNLLL